MPSTTQLKASLCGAVALAVLLSATGCSEYIDPWRDDVFSSSVVTTASVEGARASESKPTVRRRDCEGSSVASQEGLVGHFPLWWEDPHTACGSENGTFAWTCEDYVAMPYVLGRFILNGIGWPISVAVYPPQPKWGSDGVLATGDWGELHDPAPLPSGVSPTPVDILEIGSVPEPSANSDEPSAT